MVTNTNECIKLLHRNIRGPLGERERNVSFPPFLPIQPNPIHIKAFLFLAHSSIARFFVKTILPLHFAAAANNNTATMQLRHSISCLAICCATASAFAPATRSTCRSIGGSSVSTTHQPLRLSTLLSDDTTEPEITPAFPLQDKDGIWEIENQEQHK